jgi:hypothetical protein
MAIEEYVVGQPVVFRDRVYADSTLTDLVDPDDITLTIKPPTDVAVTFTYTTPGEVTREEEGVYAVQYEVDEEGDWNYRWESTNPDTVVQGVVTVYENNVD